MKFLLVPENNSLSHVAKCLAVRASLLARGHEVLVAVSRRSSRFMADVGIPHRILPDIQENDEAGFPTVEWFRRPRRIADCIAAEVKLLQEYRPDRVLGVFRFTLKASACLVGVPFDSLTCGCMLPESPEVLGFGHEEPGIDLQRHYLDTFYRYSGAKMSIALESLGLHGVVDIRSMLKGDRTFLWDFPEFSPLALAPGNQYVGPICWHGWPEEPVNLERLRSGGEPLAIVAFGTCMASPAVASRFVRVLCDLNYRVLLAAGGQEEVLQAVKDHPQVTACSFAPLHLLFPHAALLVCHGGQMTLFEALARKVPVLVMPFQPEQAHNGVCLERLGCGQRLLPAQPFLGNPGVYTEALAGMTDDDLASAVHRLQATDRGELLAAAGKAMARYGGAETVASLLEKG